MTTKKTQETKDISQEVKKETQEEKKSSRYFYAIGRRKTSIAKVKLFPTKTSKNVIIVNERKINNYFPIVNHQDIINAPLALTGKDDKFKVVIKVVGGGVSAQAEAIRLGIARALVILDKDLKKVLKSEGFLKRDAREVERKKPGLKKARKSPQWAKR